MKYVMLAVTHGETTCKVPVIFPDILAHSDVAKVLRHMILRQGARKAEPVSAGFIELDSLMTHGESETLQLKADPTDADTILNYPYFYGLA